MRFKVEVSDGTISVNSVKGSFLRSRGFCWTLEPDVELEFVRGKIESSTISTFKRGKGYAQDQFGASQCY
jgi:hypothetical protein